MAALFSGNPAEPIDPQQISLGFQRIAGIYFQNYIMLITSKLFKCLLQKQHRSQCIPMHPLLWILILVKVSTMP